MAEFNLQTRLRAIDSAEHGPRLLEISGEHVRLAKELICNTSAYTMEQREEMRGRIEQLRQERDSILSLYADSVQDPEVIMDSGSQSSAPMSGIFGQESFNAVDRPHTSSLRVVSD
ncbi:hypothetical protein [Cohnella herbarum]|uniref:hypothetical protein n=1 Tax=Cohnella herbarum TaxID=2728023 RepID=UPI0015821DEA|nr:hypothetical protein [Cohnella herbarum]